MPTRRADKLLWTAAAALAAAGVGVVAWALLDSPETATVGGAAVVTTRPAAAPAQAKSLDSVAWSRDLRRPLYDPPPPVPVATSAPVAPPISVKLVGTATDGGRGQALLTLANNRTRFVAVGESAGGAEVLSVAPGTAVVRYAGRDVTLTVPKEKAR